MPISQCAGVRLGGCRERYHPERSRTNLSAFLAGLLCGTSRILLGGQTASRACMAPGTARLASTLGSTFAPSRRGRLTGLSLGCVGIYLIRKCIGQFESSKTCHRDLLPLDWVTTYLVLK